MVLVINATQKNMKKTYHSSKVRSRSVDLSLPAFPYRSAVENKIPCGVGNRDTALDAGLAHHGTAVPEKLLAPAPQSPSVSLGAL